MHMKVSFWGDLNYNSLKIPKASLAAVWCMHVADSVALSVLGRVVYVAKIYYRHSREVVHM